MRIRVASYNIQFGFGQDGRYDLDRTAGGIADADIVCLQEVTAHWRACNGDDQPYQLSRKLDMFAAHGAGFELDSSHRDDRGRVINRRRSFGNMVLSKWPIIYSRSHSLNRPPTPLPNVFFGPRTDLPRCAVESIIDIPNLPTRVMSVHLSHLPGKQRQVQVEALRTLTHLLPEEAQLWQRADRANEPWTQGRAAPPVVERTIIGGDFNFQPNDPEYAQMLRPFNGRRLVDGWCCAWPSSQTRAATCAEQDGPDTTLDYIFLTAGWSEAVVHAEVRNDNDASDHFPLIVDLDW